MASCQHKSVDIVKETQWFIALCHLVIPGWQSMVAIQTQLDKMSHKVVYFEHIQLQSMDGCIEVFSYSDNQIKAAEEKLSF